MMNSIPDYKQEHGTSAVLSGPDIPTEIRVNCAEEPSRSPYTGSSPSRYCTLDYVVILDTSGWRRTSHRMTF
ncbi:hypothetical protein ACFL3F_02390 [Planctomycetota bacterium]